MNLQFSGKNKQIPKDVSLHYLNQPLTNHTVWICSDLTMRHENYKQNCHHEYSSKLQFLRKWNLIQNISTPSAIDFLFIFW